MLITTDENHTFAPAFLAALVVAVHIPVGSIVPSVGLYRVPKKSTGNFLLIVLVIFGIFHMELIVS